MQKICIIFIGVLIALNPLSSYSKNKRIASFPFEMIGSYVVLEVKINNSTPLKFILDSGIRQTLITELFEDDKVDLNYNDTTELQGLGNEYVLKALLSDNNLLKVGRLQMKKSTVVFLQSDMFNLSAILGQKINGILGVEMFKNHVVDINYGTMRINIYDPEGFIASDKYEWIPMETSALSKMFIQINVKEVNGESYKKLKVLLDTGAETSAWLQTMTKDAVKASDKSIYGVIGEGLNGEILGSFSRLQELCIGSYCIPNPIVAFPDSAAIGEALRMPGRDGTVGSQILKRFNMIFDYRNKRFYFVKNHYFKDPFDYNISGVEVVQTLLLFPVFEVNKVWKNSQAEKAGIKKGDIVFEINNEKTYFKTLAEIKKIFSTPSKRPLNLLIKRNDEFMKIQLDMKDEL